MLQRLSDNKIFDIFGITGKFKLTIEILIQI